MIALLPIPEKGVVQVGGDPIQVDRNESGHVRSRDHARSPRYCSGVVYRRMVDDSKRQKWRFVVVQIESPVIKQHRRV